MNWSFVVQEAKLIVSSFDRRSVLMMGALASIFMPTALEASGSSSRTRGFHGPTELAWIIAAMTPLGLQSGGIIARNTDYFRAVEAWFAPVRSHPLIAALGSDFNLPRLVGNAANYDFVRGANLRRQQNTQALWGDVSGDLFTTHLTMIEGFAERSRARAFMHRNRAVIERGGIDLLRAIDLTDIRRWLEMQFSARPRTVKLFVSPLTSGLNWTTLEDSEPKIWVPPPRPETFSNPVERFLTIGTVFTEVDHNYINPATSVRRAAVDNMIVRRDDWGTSTVWENYETAELVFNEYMTWATFLEYAFDRMATADFGVFRGRIVRFMETRRGFVRFGQFADTLARARRQSPIPIEQMMDGLISNRGDS